SFGSHRGHAVESSKKTLSIAIHHLAMVATARERSDWLGNAPPLGSLRQLVATAATQWRARKKRCR
ncbi:MAG: hypothetical protein ACK5AM_18645, partial [Pirellulaceae bacterium]